MTQRIDITGQKFNKLTAVRFDENNPRRGSKWFFQCECGMVKSIDLPGVKTGSIKSCGCLLKNNPKMGANFRTHGKSRSSEHKKWLQARCRCYYKGHDSYPHYGGRGIKMCESWRMDFAQFLTDMGPCPKGYSLERMDVNGDYSPNNCKWIPMSKQAENKTSTIWVEAEGVKMCITKATTLYKVHRGTIRRRMGNGLSFKEAMKKSGIHV